VFEIIMLSKIFRSQKEEAIRRWRELHKEELRYLYHSPNVITGIPSSMTKLGRKACVTYVEERNTCRVLVGKPDRQDLEELGVEEMVLLKWLLREEHWMAWTGFIWLRIGIGVGPL